MKIAGTATLNAPVDRVWAAFNDPAVLARCLPGCESLTETGPDAYAMRVTAGVAAVKGTYEGTVSLADKQEPSSFTMKAQGAGGPGTVAADVAVRLAPSATGGTDLSYDADAVVGGMIGGVGQRMLTGVTKKMAAEFFRAVDDDIAGVRTVPADASAPATTASDASAPPVYAGRSATATANANLSMDDNVGMLVGLALGALIALGGVVIGSRIGRRR